MGPQRALLENWNTGDGGGEVRFWLEMMERRRSDFEKTNLQAYTDSASEAMEETIHGRGGAGGDDPFYLFDNMVRTSMVKKIPPTEEVLRDIFKKYDANGDGRLSKAELKDAFRHLGSRMPGWRAGRVLHHADGNGDGFVSKEELSELVKYAKKHGYSV
ncbi:uncharacterized protein LOC132183914 [Corylus avellana]|uniref:uncharacterized protein LOC132183914 n=1 Tax=Corylus avellana TaxID=13451 RepID=UPI00286B109E|nr:uncharacterized protein LOC132183914 [Corylus avellana]